MGRPSLGAGPAVFGGAPAFCADVLSELSRCPISLRAAFPIVYCEELPKTLAFYRDELGFEVDFDLPRGRRTGVRRPEARAVGAGAGRCEGSGDRTARASAARRSAGTASSCACARRTSTPRSPSCARPGVAGPPRPRRSAVGRAARVHRGSRGQPGRCSTRSAERDDSVRSSWLPSSQRGLVVEAVVSAGPACQVGGVPDDRVLDARPARRRARRSARRLRRALRGWRRPARRSTSACCRGWRQQT